jgi:hypothetical protein
VVQNKKGARNMALEHFLTHTPCHLLPDSLGSPTLLE